ncbi:MAG: NAD-dependent succinate-semialdehyde dehydrogenase [Sphingomonadales bacterium]|nr:NAD-dependent succinate-semialdehyde dehydrogenase [Sphingomonadales bacterium]
MQLKNKNLFRQQAYINGTWVDADNGAVTEITNPATGEVIGTVPNMGKAEAARAIEGSQEAFGAWKEQTAKQRAIVLRKLYELIMANVDDLATILTTEQGKPLVEAKGEVIYAASFIEWFAEEGKRVYGDVIPSSVPGLRMMTIKQPIGVVGAITPWNFPSAMLTRKAGPAWAAGCPVVAKPAPETPFSALALAVLAEEAGLPAGIFNVVTGDAVEIGGAMMASSDVRKITFTGSTAVGKLLMRQSADTVKKLSLELGGNAAFIVFDDADIDQAVAGAIACKYRNTGQTCVCANRILVQEGVYDEFMEKFVTATKKIKVGSGFEEGVGQGPLITEAAVEKVEAHIADAKAKGGKLLLGGKRHELGHTFFEPTIIGECSEDMVFAQEETFGPMAPVFKFSTDDEAVRIANSTPFGLASYFYARDVGRVFKVAEALETGIVGVNTGIISTEVAPFGGVKESGLGREGSKYGIDEYVEIKYISLAV